MWPFKLIKFKVQKTGFKSHVKNIKKKVRPNDRKSPQRHVSYQQLATEWSS